jgi:hypothetical protein
MARSDRPRPAGAPDAPDPANYEPIDAPLISAGTAAIQSTGNEFLLLFTRARPVIDKRAHAIAQVAINDIVASVSISPHTLKDIALLLSDAVANYEREYGELVTPYTRRRAAERGQS